MRTRYKIYDNCYPHFATCSIVGWLPVFVRPQLVEIVLDSWRFLMTHDRMQLYGYCVLENHLHFIASSHDLSDQIGDFKSYTARRIIDWLIEHNDRRLLHYLEMEKRDHKQDRDYQLWQEGSHPQQIDSDEMMWQKLEYTHNNPVRRGYVDDPLHWRYSSARNYAGMPGLVPVRTDWR
ncbi:MAG: transposase [Pirellulales bacterium]